MKKLSYLMSLLLVILSFTSCDKDEDRTLTVDKSAIEVIINETEVVLIKSGEAPYSAIPINKEIASVTVEKNEVRIKGLKEGQTTIQLADKNGNAAAITVKVIKDPYEAEKKDATTRISWNKISKKEGVDKGTFSFLKAKDKTVKFAWKSENEKNSVVLTFTDAKDLLEASQLKSVQTKESPVYLGKLDITEDGKTSSHNLWEWKIIKLVPVKGEREAVNQLWITFKAGGKRGLMMGTLSTLK